MMPVHDIELSGADYFLSAMDRLVRANGCADSPCRMVVSMDGKADSVGLQDMLNRSPVIRWMAGTRTARRLPFAIPQWQSNGSGGSLPVAEDRGQWENLGENMSLLQYSRVPGQQTPASPLYFAVSRHGERAASCILHWDHTLMDAHGAEILLGHLARSPEKSNIEYLLQRDGQVQQSRVVRSQGFFKRLAYARQSVFYIAEKSTLPIAILKKLEPASDFADQYCLIRFTTEETQKIHARCESVGLSYYHSLFYLGAAVRAINAVRLQRGEEPAPYLVPVPLNLRKKGGRGPAFSNNVSFLFYRVEPVETASLATTLEVLKKQMKEQIAAGVPYSYLEMMNILRRLPLPMYAKLVSGPTRGQMASFFFSYTGDCCPDVSRFMGREVKEVTHLAPATSIPGLSTVFTLHRNRLRAVLSLRDSLLTKDDYRLFQEQLRKDLLGESN